MAKEWFSVLEVKGRQWQITEADVSELGDLIEDAETWLNRAMSAERNAVITARVNDAFDGLIRYMRNMKNRKFFTPPLENADLVSLGLRPRDTIITPVSPPTGQAEADVTYPGPHLLMLHMKALSGTLLDPRADHGFRVFFGILPAGGATHEEAEGPMRYLVRAAVVGGELPHSKFTRRRRVLMEFPAEDSGKTVFFSVRFENSKGQAGPWGPVFSAIIP
jgi:hypothetical protein